MMGCALLWTLLSLLAVACAQGAGGDISLADIIGDHSQVLRSKAMIQSRMRRYLPYAEGSMPTPKGMREGTIPEGYYLRKMIRPEPDSWTDSIEINPHNDLESFILTNSYPITVEVTHSVAKVDTKRVGWNKEETTDIGGSVTATASGDIGLFDASLSTTVCGNYRTTGGTSGDSTMQTEKRIDRKTIQTCPAEKQCIATTWTYIRTVKGKCLLVPFRDTNRLHEAEKDGGLQIGNASIALVSKSLEQCYASPTQKKYDHEILLDTFFPRHTHEQGPKWHGVTMHDLASSEPKIEEPCSFSYTLRLDDGSPVRTQAFLEFPMPLDKRVKPPTTEVPQAIQLVVDGDDKYCALNKGWFWQPGGYFLIPEKSGGTGDWVPYPDLPEPEGARERCAGLWGGATGQRSTRGSLSRVKNKLEVPPRNTLKDDVKINMIIDDVPEFLEQQEARET